MLVLIFEIGSLNLNNFLSISFFFSPFFRRKKGKLICIIIFPFITLNKNLLICYMLDIKIWKIFKWEGKVHGQWRHNFVWGGWLYSVYSSCNWKCFEFLRFSKVYISVYLFVFYFSRWHHPMVWLIFLLFLLQ